MFVLSKLLSAMTQPMFWLLLWCVGALCVIRWRARWAHRMLWTGIWMMVALGFQSLPDALLRPLENRYPVPEMDVISQHAGVIVLGGALEHPQSWMAHGQVPLGQSAERMTVPVGWMRSHTHLQLLFSGGEGRLRSTGVTEGQLAQQFYREQGLDMGRVHIEPSARTTRENAQRVQQTLGAACAQSQWLLVTSAWHLPRAVPEFEAVGCRITPYPVDFRTGAHTPWSAYHWADSVMRWQVALHEWLGQLAYGLTRGAAAN